MADPFSVVSCAITVIDVVITHGERTAAIISDIHTFGSVSVAWRMRTSLTSNQDSTDLYHLVSDETIQNKLLKQLLFSECGVSSFQGCMWPGFP